MKYISFVVPSYNSQDYMEHCINSLLIGGEDVEIIIIDDGSTDNTGKIADDYAKKYPTSIAGIICWNAPSKMNTRLSAKSNAQNLKIGMVHLLSILFNTNSRCLTGDMKSITDNEILLRISNKPGDEKQGFVNLDLAA